MAKKARWECDGCGRIVTTDEWLPMDWKHMEAVVREVGTEVGDTVHADLCSGCAAHLACVIDVKSWPREAK